MEYTYILFQVIMPLVYLFAVYLGVKSLITHAAKVFAREFNKYK